MYFYLTEVFLSVIMGTDFLKRRMIMDVRTEKESSFTELFDTYGELLTPRKKEICELYLNYDLSLGEIGEEKGISRQSVSDCLRTSCEQMKEYD